MFQEGPIRPDGARRRAGYRRPAWLTAEVPVIRFPQAPRPKAASSGPPWLALIVTALALVPLSQGAAAPTPAKPRANLDASAGPMVGDASMPALGSALYRGPEAGDRLSLIFLRRADQGQAPGWIVRPAGSCRLTA